MYKYYNYYIKKKKRIKHSITFAFKSQQHITVLRLGNIKHKPVLVAPTEHSFIIIIIILILNLLPTSNLPTINYVLLLFVYSFVLVS